ncbi:glucose transporter type 1 isoform X4 [Vespula maculifrons]|uniref:Glucose transporter type 1 isoform X4 n=1 Tax=Vespula maculifrons TaxID=7453 RepID=A0ABD2CRL0_VESMC
MNISASPIWNITKTGKESIEMCEDVETWTSRVMFYRSMLNCVNALEGHIPPAESAALMVAEEKPHPDSLVTKSTELKAKKGIVLIRMWISWSMNDVLSMYAWIQFVLFGTTKKNLRDNDPAVGKEKFCEK